MEYLTDTSSRVTGVVTVNIEGIGAMTIEGNGASVTQVIAAAGCAIIGKLFELNPDKWDIGFRPSDSTILVRPRPH